jgi:hypothetical protein
MKISNQHYYHVHKQMETDIWSIGQKKNFDKSRLNHHIGVSKINCTSSLPENYRSDFTNSRKLVDKLTEMINVINQIPNIQEQNNQLQDLTLLCQAIIKQNTNYLGYYIKYLRELIFEDIRSKEFNDKPSRFHSIWLCNENELESWYDIISQGGKIDVDVCKVSCTGVIHHANASLILADSLQIFEYEDLARRYWQETPFTTEHCKDSEILFEGELTIIEKYNR